MRRLEAWTRLGLVVWAMVITMARAGRPPNDFAEAHWLLDYRFGFIRRGFAGSLLSLASSAGLSGPSERVIAALAFLAFGLLMLVLLWAAARVVCSVEEVYDELLILDKPDSGSPYRLDLATRDGASGRSGRMTKRRARTHLGRSRGLDDSAIYTTDPYQV